MKNRSFVGLGKSCFVFVCITALLIAGVGNATASNKKTATAQEAYELLVAEGMTCNTQQVLVGLNDTEHAVLSELVLNTYSGEELTTVVEMRERNCFTTTDTKSSTESLGGITPNVTGTYSVEFIEETTGSGGSYPSSIVRDSSSTNWMCNDGSPESPADYVAQYYVSNSYSNRSALRIRGTNAFASCYIGNPTASRVYSDNDIRACFGYWSVYFCAIGTDPKTYESVIWIQ